MKDNNLLIVSANYILPMNSEPIHNCALVIENGLIKDFIHNFDCDNDYQINNVVNYPEAILMPGLVNMHTHLDYSAIKLPTVPLFQWIPELVLVSRKMTSEELIQSNYLGVEQSLICGVTSVVDCSFSGQSYRPLLDYNMVSLIALELFGIDSNKSEIAFESYLKKLELLQQNISSYNHNITNPVQVTISPHAIYTVCDDLWLKASAWAKNNNKYLVSHLSESINELDWCLSSDDAIDKNICKSFGLTFEQLTKLTGIARNVKSTTTSHLHNLGVLETANIFAHGVHLDCEDIKLLSNQTIALCPRSNNYLGVGQFDFSNLSNINFALGTDSRASNYDLDLLNEARDLLNKTNNITCESLLKSMTIQSARALNFEDKIGSLEIGKRADLVVLRKNNNVNLKVAYTNEFDSNSIYSMVFDSSFSVTDVYLAGKHVVDNKKLNKL